LAFTVFIQKEKIQHVVELDLIGGHTL